jgi:hypothetical protein
MLVAVLSNDLVTQTLHTANNGSNAQYSDLNFKLVKILKRPQTECTPILAKHNGK